MASTSWCQILLIGPMMATKTTIAALALACSVAQAAPTFGIVRLDGNGHADLVTAQPLRKDQELHVQFPDEQGKPTCCKRLSSTHFKPSAGDQVVATNELTSEEPQIYSADVPKAWATTPFVGVAAAGKKLTARNSQQGLEVKERGGKTHVATACLSSEGMHLIERVHQSERTHLYLSLGYTLETPTCPK